MLQLRSTPVNFSHNEHMDLTYADDGSSARVQKQICTSSIDTLY